MALATLSTTEVRTARGVGSILANGVPLSAEPVESPAVPVVPVDAVFLRRVDDEKVWHGPARVTMRLRPVCVAIDLPTRPCVAVCERSITVYPVYRREDALRRRKRLFWPEAKRTSSCSSSQLLRRASWISALSLRRQTIAQLSITEKYTSTAQHSAKSRTAIGKQVSISVLATLR